MVEWIAAISLLAALFVWPNAAESAEKFWAFYGSGLQRDFFRRRF